MSDLFKTKAPGAVAAVGIADAGTPGFFTDGSCDASGAISGGVPITSSWLNDLIQNLCGVMDKSGEPDANPADGSTEDALARAVLSISMFSAVKGIVENGGNVFAFEGALPAFDATSHPSGTVWLDTSVNPIVWYISCGSAWETVSPGEGATATTDLDNNYVVEAGVTVLTTAVTDSGVHVYADEVAVVGAGVNGDTLTIPPGCDRFVVSMEFSGGFSRMVAFDVTPGDVFTFDVQGGGLARWNNIASGQRASAFGNSLAAFNTGTNGLFTGPLSYPNAARVVADSDNGTLAIPMFSNGFSQEAAPHHTYSAGGSSLSGWFMKPA